MKPEPCFFEYSAVQALPAHGSAKGRPSQISMQAVAKDASTKLMKA